MPPIGARVEFVPLDGGRVRILRSTAAGGGTPLLLLHGGGADNAEISWRQAFDHDLDRTVITPDLPGFGRTDLIPTDYGPAATADLVARLCRALGIDAVVVAGVSMGGDIALNLALRHPGLVRGLILVAPGGLVPVFRNRALQVTAWLIARLPDLLLTRLAALANRHAERAIGAIVRDPATLPPGVLEEFARESQRPGAGLGYTRYNQATLGPWRMRNNLLPVVHRISVPTLFFHGQNDPIVPLAGSRSATGTMPQARLVVVPDCGHWAQLEAPQRFWDEVGAFLPSVPDGSTEPG